MKTQEQDLSDRLEKPDLMIIGGSRLYGTDTPESDYDYRGFVIPPFEYLVGLSRFEHHVVREPDSILYSLKRFLELLMLGDPGCCEILFATERSIVERSDIGGVILRNQALFTSKKFAIRMRGYARSEWRKVTGTQLITTKRTPTEDETIEHIRQTFGPPKDEMDEIIRLLFEHHPKEIRSARRKLGAKRKLQIERYGYCTSSACHTIRLLGQLQELTDTGKITFPRPNAAQLLSIKKGELGLGEVTECYDDLSNIADQSIEHTDLPEHAQTKQIKLLYHEIVAHAIFSDQPAKDYKYDYDSKWLECWS